MARNITEAEVIVTLNGEAARNELKRLETEIEHYEKAAADAYKAGDKALGDKMSKNADQLRKQFSVAKKEMKDFSDMMKSLNSKSLNELSSAARQLEKQIRGLTPGTKEFVEKSKQLKQVNTRIKELRDSYRGLVQEQKNATLSLKGLADGFNKYFGMVTAGIAAVTGLSMAFRKCAEEAAKLDDVYSDVMKTTGLLHDEVAALDKELMKIDTRTSREQLLLLARDAGKLGITGTENILGFVRAADQIQVALGEDLGEGAIRNLGKIADVLGYTSSMGIEQSLLSIASAVNAVGQASTASEGYLVDFTQRLAGVAAQTNISAADIIGFASGLDQSAMKVEMAATAFQKFLMKIYEDPAKFAQYAKMEVSEFTELLSNDANKAIITILKALKDQDGFASLVPIFQDMGLDGARAVSVLAAMATNIQAVTDAQELANDEFEKATSVTEEYLVKNNNLNAQLEKARKEFHNASIELGQSLNPIMLKSTKAVTYIIKALAKYGKEIKAAVIAIAALTIAVKANAIAEGLRNAAVKAGTLLTKSATVVTNFLKIGYYKLTGQTIKAAAAQTALNTAMSASVFGVIAIAVGLLVGALVHLIQKNREAAETTEDLSEKENYEMELSQKIASAKSEEAGKIEALTKIVHNENIAYDERLKALKELKKIVPDYHASLTKEGVLINDNITAVENYVKALKREAVIKKLGDEFGEIEAKKIELESMIADLEESIEGEELVDEATWTMNKKVSSASVQILKLKKELNEVTEKSQQVERLIEKAVATDLGGGTNRRGGGGGSDAGDQSYQNAQKNLERAQREEENILKQSYLDMEMSYEEYQEKMRQINLKYLEEKVNLAREYGKDETSVLKAFLDAQIEAVNLVNKELDELYQQRDNWEKAQLEEFENYMKELEKLQEEAQKVKDKLNPSAARARQMKEELDALDELHNAKLLSEEEYEKAVQQLRKKYAEQDLQERLKNVQEYTEKVSSIMSRASGFVTSLKEYETQKAEAEYQAQLTAAGDNAEQREQIEAEYEQKKLDIQKKYADTEMAINIAKTIAAGALAAIQAFAQLGPIAGAAAAALIAATTAIEIATIVQQRNAIKNASVNSSSSSSITTGKRTVNNEGYSEGGFTEDHSTMTTVGEKGTEFVAPHWMVQRNPVLFANLERYRQTGSHGRSGSISRGFADGGFTGATPTNIASPGASMADIEAAVEAAIIRSMASGAIRAYLVRNDLTELDNQTNRFKKQTSR